MELFSTALVQMLALFIFITIGYAMRKLQLLPENANITFSRLENYVLVPALIINTFQSQCTVKNLVENSRMVLVSSVLLLLCILAGIVLAPLFTKVPGEKGIYRYSVTVANFGFMGNAVMLGLFGEEMLFRYMIFCLPLNFFVYSLGIVWITAGHKGFSPKMFLNPMFFSLIIGTVLGLTGFPIPVFLERGITAAAACFSPLAMLLTGFVIGGYELKKLFNCRNVYILSVLRLVVIPCAAAVILRIFHIPREIQLAALCALAMPLGLNTIVFPAAYGGDDRPGASMALISNLMGVITIPIVLAVLLP